MVRFRATILEGHKGAAAEVPFDPSVRWRIPPVSLWKGRRGHRVRGRLNGVPFESAVVPRTQRFWVLIDEATQAAAEVSIGDQVTIELEPCDEALPTKRFRSGSQ